MKEKQFFGKIETEWNLVLKKLWVKVKFRLVCPVCGEVFHRFLGIKLEEQVEIMRQVCICEEKRYPKERGFAGGDYPIRYLLKYLRCKTAEERRRLTDEMIYRPQRLKQLREKAKAAVVEK